MRRIVSILVASYHLLIRLYPRPFREEFGPEMEMVFLEQMAGAAAQGWIERAEEESGVENGRERKAYRLTDLGRRLLNAETVRLQSLVAVAQQAEGSITP